MQSLSARERACLTYIKHHPDSDAADHFSQGLLDKLTSRGLIESHTSTAYPALPTRTGYRLSPKGHAAVDSG
jgi:hypothetical protein